jgi:hypothetical protein
VRSRLNDFAFRGLSAAHAIRDLQADGILRTRVSTDSERADTDLFAPVPDHIRQGSLQMQRAFRLLFVFENLVRDFVGSRFLDVDGDDWFEKRASVPMKAKVEERRRKEAKNAWHVGRHPEPLFYLDFGDLGLLIINHWDVFRDFFDPGQAWVTSRIQEAERSRNVIAHTNVLADQEISRLEMYLRDWISQVG